MLPNVNIQKITKIITSFSKFVTFNNPYISDIVKFYDTVHLNSINKNILKLDFFLVIITMKQNTHFL